MNDDAPPRASDDDTSDDLRAITDVLDRAVDSVEMLDALLFLVESPTRWYALQEVARGVGLDLDTTHDALRELRARGIVSDVGNSLFRLTTAGAVPHPRLRELSRVCTRHRMAVVDHVSRRAVGRYRAIAEAFTRGRRR